MPASYAATAHPERDLLLLTLSGFFDLAGLADFDRARHAAHERLCCARNRHDTLIAGRELRLQAQDVVTPFRAMLAEPQTRARRIAFVTGAGAIRMQVRRIADRPDIRCFAGFADAETWLAEAPAGYALAG